MIGTVSTKKIDDKYVTVHGLWEHERDIVHLRILYFDGKDSHVLKRHYDYLINTSPRTACSLDQFFMMELEDCLIDLFGKIGSKDSVIWWVRFREEDFGKYNWFDIDFSNDNNFGVFIELLNEWNEELKKMNEVQKTC